MRGSRSATGRAFVLIAGAIGTSTWCFARAVGSEFQWAVITDVGNAPYISNGIGGPRGGIVYPFAHERGSVGYVYRISTLEVTTAQWMEFLNAIAPLQPTALTWGRPSYWGAEDDPSQPSGNYRLRSDVPNAGMIPVHAVSWRHAAMYVNWLCNDKRAALSAIANGAYDISTFGENPDGTITDQLTHHPDAKYWIPTYDEWIKAAHYDPNKDGEGQGGWWRYMYSQDTALTYGWPGEGQSAGGGIGAPPPGFPQAADLPLGSYGEFTSAWGLLDTSGGATEWTEEMHIGRNRRILGSPVYAASPDWRILDDVEGAGSASAGVPLTGLRIASRVPAPGAAVIIMTAVWPGLRRRRG